MHYVKWTLRILILLLLGGFLHYTMPRHEVVRIVGVETRLESFGLNRVFYASAPTGASESDTRDVRYIETFRPSGRELVFRNEDTGWGWPPYFKVNSADLQARARDSVSTSVAPEWVAITYYGWRSRLLSIYPNAVRMRPALGPEERVFPWASLVILTVLAGLALWLWLLWRRFRRARLDPALQRAEGHAQAARSRLGRAWRRLRGR